ncbi:MAG: leucine-rich repeat domain-containing protein [Prevotella sp.]|nr:leucine-rich repeat domain-containing protein [Prevotella sp.]
MQMGRNGLIGFQRNVLYLRPITIFYYGLLNHMSAFCTIIHHHTADFKEAGFETNYIDNTGKNQQKVINMKTKLFLLTCLLLPTVANADEINGFYYSLNFENKTAEVISSPNENKYTGDIVIPETVVSDEITYDVTSIGISAFSGYTGLTSITIPSSITIIGSSAFNGCTGLKKAIFNSVSYFCSIIFSNKEANPLYYAHHLYYINSDEVTTINVPDGITEISAGAFAGGSEITKITIPESVKKIGKDAFSGCNNNNLTIGYATEAQLKDMTYAEGESNPMSKAKMFLVGGKEITEMIFDEDVHEKGFLGATWLQKVTLNEGVTKIGKEAFRNCSKLNTVIFNTNGVTEIDNDAFNGCTKLSSIALSGSQEKELPTQLQRIGIASFRNCQQLESITIPQSVTFIGTETFLGCYRLSSVNILADLTTLPSQMFNGCSSLKQGNLSAGIKTVNYRAFYGCSALTSLPNVTTIGVEAYANCSGFTTLTLPVTITTIGERAFANCNNITDLTIPEEVSGLNIGVEAFYAAEGKGNLKRIYSYPMIAPSAHANAFDGQTGIQLFYSEGGTGYTDEPWSNFNPTVFQEKTITWYLDDNTDNNYYCQETVQVGQPIPEVSTPIRDGWDFTEWLWPNDTELTLMPNDDLELRGYFTAKKNSDKSVW